MTHQMENNGLAEYARSVIRLAAGFDESKFCAYVTDHGNHPGDEEDTLYVADTARELAAKLSEVLNPLDGYGRDVRAVWDPTLKAFVGLEANVVITLKEEL